MHCPYLCLRARPGRGCKAFDWEGSYPECQRQCNELILKSTLKQTNKQTNKQINNILTMTCVQLLKFRMPSTDGQPSHGPRRRATSTWWNCSSREVLIRTWRTMWVSLFFVFIFYPPCITPYYWYDMMRRQYGRTPLLSASENGHKEVVQLLVDHGAETDAKNKVRGCLCNGTECNATQRNVT